MDLSMEQILLTPALGRLRQEDYSEFQDSLGCIVRNYNNKQTNKFILKEEEKEERPEPRLPMNFVCDK